MRNPPARRGLERAVAQVLQHLHHQQPDDVFIFHDEHDFVAAGMPCAGADSISSAGSNCHGTAAGRFRYRVPFPTWLSMRTSRGLADKPVDHRQPESGALADGFVV
jgi:hypothetical protein